MAKSKSTSRSGLTPEQTSHRILAAIWAVSELQEHLVATDELLSAAETKKLSDATKAYRDIVRDADNRRETISPQEAHELLLTICDGVATHDAVKEANTDARKNRARERKRVEQAFEALTKRAKGAPTDQVALPLPDSDGDTTGLGRFADETRKVVYTALLDLDKRGGLDKVQSDLMVDLASEKLEAIAFVLDAGEAIEDEEADADPEGVAELEAMEAANSGAAQPSANSLPI